MRWINKTLPQTLLIATYLFYIDVVFGVLYGSFRSLLLLPFLVGSIVGGLGISNERKFGYWVGIISSGAYMCLILFLFFRSFSFALVLEMVFSVALFALLAHPYSYLYQRTWFR